MRTGDVTIFSVTNAAVQDPSLPDQQRSTGASGNATLREAERIMVVCNACRYCEGYCAVFRAMEKRRSFPAGDLRYLANLCHDCGECLYACQYATPHEFAIRRPNWKKLLQSLIELPGSNSKVLGYPADQLRRRLKPLRDRVPRECGNTGRDRDQKADADRAPRR